MSGYLAMPLKIVERCYQFAVTAPLPLVLAFLVSSLFLAVVLLYLGLFILAPNPRAPLASEKTYITTLPDGSISPPRPLPDWHNDWLKHRRAMDKAGNFSDATVGAISPATLALSLVVPAYNEEARIGAMLLEAVEHLDSVYGRPSSSSGSRPDAAPSPTRRRAHRAGAPAAAGGPPGPRGYEILVVNDGSADRTVPVVLDFARRHALHDVLRVVTLRENRGKGGAVTHGFRHVRGAHAAFADADGASRFADLARLVDGCDEVADSPGRGVAVGSRAHLVGSEAVVKRSVLRNALMHSFHLLLRILTPPATSRIRDTQCGFKVFSRAALPHIVPYMHAEGWIFDVEMLMLAESAPPGYVEDGAGNVVGTSLGIRVAEVPIGWKEVGGSKLNVVWDSLGMAWGLAVLRGSWALGVYRRR